MTDITELAQREKFEAWLEGAEALPWGYLKNRRASDSEYLDPNITDMWAAWKGASAELVEALEKAKGMEAYWKVQCRGITDHCEVLQARIAELESRTVKLPDALDFDCEMENGDYDIDEEPYLRGKVDGFNHALTKIRRLNGTAGIKVEAE